MKKILIIAVVIAAVAAVIALRPTGNAVSGGVCEGCNVVLITVDTLRPDHLSAYGYGRETSPNIRSLAEKSSVFTNAFSQTPFTPASHWSIMSGTYPHTHNLQRNKEKFFFEAEANLTRTPLVAVALKGMGYDVYETAGFASHSVLQDLSPGLDTFEYGNVTGAEPSEITDKAMEWLEGRDGKFFLWVHYWDPHAPYSPPPGFDVFTSPEDEALYGEIDRNLTEKERLDPIYTEDGYFKFMESKYDGEIMYVDAEVGRLLEKADAVGGETIIIVASDHGECFGERYYGSYAADGELAVKCHDHSWSLFDEELRVPLIIHNPRDMNAQSISEMAQLVDIAPTILDMLGMEKDGRMEGKSLLPLMEEGIKVNDYVFSDIYASRGIYAKSVRDERWKLVKISNWNDGSEKLVLNDMKVGEDVDFSGIYPDVAEKMEEILDSRIPPAAAVKSEISGDIRKLLESLGYV